jgi:peptidoglycan-associated lipoprotein
MKLPISYRTALILLLVGLPLAACAKKPPAPAAPPPAPVETKPTPPPTPPPAQPEPPPPTPPTLQASDFQPAFFDLDSYTIRADARTALDSDAKLLRDNATVNVTIEGHCDERGTVEYNQALGEKRAMAARDYLVAAGIAQSRLDVISYGKERPFATGHDESSWQQNRRANFAVRP